MPDAWTYVDGEWHAGNPKLMGPMDQAFWLSSVVFDGARAFEGFVPDLDRHCARSLISAERMGMTPKVTADEVLGFAREGVARFPKGTALYIRPMFWAEHGLGTLMPDPDSTRFLMCVYESPMPGITGLSATLSPFRRAAADSAPTDAKASCLYPNGARAVKDAVARGFSNAVMLDQDGNVAEFATSNLFVAHDGVVSTPAINGTFLNGITRQRTIALLRGAGVTVLERTIRPEELHTADELFSSGNYGKVQPYVRYEGRSLQAGPFARRARELYWQFASDTASP